MNQAEGNRDAALRWFGAARTKRIEQGATPHLALVGLREAKAELVLGGRSPAAPDDIVLSSI